MTLSPLHEGIFEEFLTRGTITDERLERLPRFRRYAKSTIRTRRNELTKSRKLTAVGETVNDRGRPITIWGIR